MVLKLAAAQIRSTSNIDDNLIKLDKYAGYASKENCKIIVTPELYLTGYDSTPEFIQQNAIIIPYNDEYSYNIKLQKVNNYLDKIAKICVKNTIDIIIGFSEYNNTQNKYYNSLMWISSDGKLRSVYRKTHLWGSFEKKTFDKFEIKSNNSYNVNNNYSIIDCYGMKFGLLICFDIEFPECCRILAIKGAQCIIIPTALGGYHNKTTDIFPTVRAAENSLFIVNVNYPRPIFCGNSSICAPTGYKIAQAGNQEEQLLFATLNNNDVKYEKHRKRNPYLQDRRPELYNYLLKSKL
eukprot:251330_1